MKETSYVVLSRLKVNETGCSLPKPSRYRVLKSDGFEGEVCITIPPSFHPVPYVELFLNFAVVLNAG